MERALIIDYLESCHFDVPLTAHHSTSDYIQISCPFAKWTHTKGTDSHPSFSIRCVDGEPSTYQCFTCHEKGVFWEMLRFVGGMTGNVHMSALASDAYADDEQSPETMMERAIKRYDRDTVLREPKDMTALRNWMSAKDSYHKYMEMYLERRGLIYDILKTVVEFKWDEKEQRVMIPIYGMTTTDLRSDKNKFIGAVGRS